MIATERIWSQYQTDIFIHVANDTRSLIVEACAGSGKTSTLVESSRGLSEFDNAVAICFNVKIKEELVKRLPAHVPALTLNALGFRAWKAFTGKTMEVDGRKIATLVREMADDYNPDYRQGVKRLVDLAKMAGIVPAYVKTETYPLTPDTNANWEQLINEYSIGFGFGEKEDRAIDLARRVLAESVRVGAERIDFNDQLYLPVIFRADFPQFDVLFVDEAQDLNEIQRVMVERSVSGKGRVIAFGDASQAIYHFRGAGANALPLLRERFNAVSLPLSICYRCSKAVVKKAQEYVPTIQAFADAPEGLVNENASWTPETFITTDVILCRNNAPLVKMAFRLLRAGKACRVMGRDVATGLVALVQRQRATTVTDLRTKIGRYVTNEIARDPNNDAAIQNLLDKQATIEVFCENARTPEEVITKIGTMFADEQGQYLMLSTIHKFKGMEAPRVFLLDPQIIGARAKSEMDRVAERNIAYVAVTRAQSELHFIRSN